MVLYVLHFTVIGIHGRTQQVYIALLQLEVIQYMKLPKYASVIHWQLYTQIK
jgi:hypothetical protein